jgi:La-related protein 7
MTPTPGPGDGEEVKVEVDTSLTTVEHMEATTVDNEVKQEQDVAAAEQSKSSRSRHRKRKLYADICKQLEFYFSDANITKNRLMQDMVNRTEYVDLITFLDFNRIKGMTRRIEDLQKALVTSDKLELSADRMGVKRRVPYDAKRLKNDEEVEACTVYVENVPKHADHAFLETIFQSFGPIAYISLPKFRVSKQPKGFAFIEFDTPEIANACVEAYKGEGACLPSDMDPASLMSIQAFNDEQQESGETAAGEAGSGKYEDDYLRVGYDINHKIIRLI